MYKRNKNNHKSYLQMGSDIKFSDIPVSYIVDADGNCYLMNSKDEVISDVVYENSEMAELFIKNSLDKKIAYLKNINYKNRSENSQVFLNKYEMYTKNKSIMNTINVILLNYLNGNSLNEVLVFNQIIFGKNGHGLSLRKVVDGKYSDFQMKEDIEFLNNFIIDPDSYIETYEKSISLI